MKEKMYWKMYQDKDSTHYASVIITQEEMMKEINYGYEMGLEDMPVFEPVFMTEEEYNSLPEFKGF